MIIKKFNLFLEKVILTKSSKSGSTKQNDIILDEPNNNKSLSSLLLLNDKLRKKEFEDLIKKLNLKEKMVNNLKLNRKFIRTLLYSNFSDNHIQRVILSLNNSQFIAEKEKEGVLKCEYCGKSPLIRNRNSFEEILNLKMPKRVSPNKMATCDHKEPKSKGGDMYDYDNLAVCCNNCNNIKSDMDYQTWLSLIDTSNKIIKDLKLNKLNVTEIKNSKELDSIKNEYFKKCIKEFIFNKVNNTE